MTLLVDQHEPISISLLLEQSVPTERVLLNKPAVPARPDYCWIDWEGKWHGVSRKQGGEFLGSVDATEAQLLEEMGGVDRLYLLIEGWISPDADGSAWAWRLAKGNERIAFRDHHYRQSYKGVRAKLARLEDLGVMVVQTADETDTALALVALYEASLKPESEQRTLKRLIKEKYWLTEEDAARKSFMLTLMGIQGAGVGEEVADALAGAFGTVAQLVRYFDAPGMEAEMAALPLRSSLLPGARKRTIGPAAVAKLKGALGL